MISHADARARLVALLSSTPPAAEPAPPVEGAASKTFRDTVDFAFEWHDVGAPDLDHFGRLAVAAFEFVAREALAHMPAETRSNLALVALEYVLGALNQAARFEKRRREKKGA